MERNLIALSRTTSSPWRIWLKRPPSVPSKQHLRKTWHTRLFHKTSLEENLTQTTENYTPTTHIFVFSYEPKFNQPTNKLPSTTNIYFITIPLASSLNMEIRALFTWLNSAASSGNGEKNHHHNGQYIGHNTTWPRCCTVKVSMRLQKTINHFMLGLKTVHYRTPFQITCIQ